MNNNKEYRVEILPHETEMFSMKSEISKPIIDSIKNLKKIAGFTFHEIPGYDLRIMGIGQIPHSLRNIFLQYNTRSGRYRIIVESPSYQVPNIQKLTMKNNNNRSLITKEIFPAVQNMLRFITNDTFWKELNELYEYYQNFTSKYSIYPQSGGSKNKKSVKKNTKN